MENSDSGANRADWHALINRRSLGSIETCISDHKYAVLLEKKHK